MNDLELEPGGVYQDAGVGQSIFIGYVNTTIFEKDKDNEKSEFIFKHKTLENAMLFYQIFNYETVEKSLKDMLREKCQFQYRIVTKHWYTTKINKVELPTQLIETLRSKALKDVKKEILEFTGHGQLKDLGMTMDSYDLAEQIELNSKFLNIYPVGGMAVTPFDVRKFLLFS